MTTYQIKLRTTERAEENFQLTSLKEQQENDPKQRFIGKLLVSRAAEHSGEVQFITSISLGTSCTLCLTTACIRGFLHPNDKHNRAISLVPAIFDIPHLCGPHPPLKCSSAATFAFDVLMEALVF